MRAIVLLIEKLLLWFPCTALLPGLRFVLVSRIRFFPGLETYPFLILPSTLAVSGFLARWPWWDTLQPLGLFLPCSWL